MTSNSHSADPDDADYVPDDAQTDEDAELGFDAVVWQLLLLINPGDDESARQQFHAWQDSIASTAPDEVGAIACLREAIDWKAGFHVETGDLSALIECIDELSARFGLRIDWGVEDASDASFLGDSDASALITQAFVQLREHGYTLWTWSPHGAAREDLMSGWITLRSDDEAMEIIAPALGIDLRPGSAF